MSATGCVLGTCLTQQHNLDSRVSQVDCQRGREGHLSGNANGNVPESGVVCPVAALVQIPQQALYHIAPSLGVLQLYRKVGTEPHRHNRYGIQL